MGWISPTGHNDPSSQWTDETNVYDNNTGSRARDYIPVSSWGAFIELTHSAIDCTKIRFWAASGANINQIDVDIYYSDGWHHLCQGAYANMEWVELSFSQHSLTKVRFRFYNADTTPPDTAASLYEVDFYGVALATVTTQAVTDILSITATGNGNITDIGSANPTKRGICWSTSENPTVADSKSEQTGSFGTGAFTRPITGLSPGVKYYVRAYAYNNAGYGYGGEVNFTTDKVAPTITTQDLTSILTTTATANGNITALGGENATVRGFKYGLTKDDTWDAHDDGDFGLGAYTKGLTDLSPNTTYWIRAYATNSIGTSYGVWVKFQTAASGVIPTGTTINIGSDYSSFTYKLQRSETDDGEAYTAYFVINTDLANKKGLTYYKRILDLHLYFRREVSGTAEIYVKRDSEANWQLQGSVALTDATLPEIIVKHLAIDVRAKDYDFKVSFANACRFLGVVFEFIPEGDR